MFLKVMLQILKAQEKGSGSFIVRIFSCADEQSSLQKAQKGGLVDGDLAEQVFTVLTDITGNEISQ